MAAEPAITAYRGCQARLRHLCGHQPPKDPALVRKLSDLTGRWVITYRGADHTVAGPAVVDLAPADLAYPRYERLALRLIGVNEFVLLTDAPVGSASGRGEPGAGG